MKNKGVVVVLTVVITLLCIYYLSFTLVSRNINERATEYATTEAGVVDLNKKQKYLDSIWTKPVYNLFGVEYTYKEVKDTELNLGLDLQGGMHVTLEVSPVDIIKNLSANPEDPGFVKAIQLAKERQKDSQERFITLFNEAFQEVNPNRQLAPLFATAANRERVSASSTDAEVIEMLNKEIEDAIDRSFIILRTRIDQFGTSQPNIQRIEGTGRIQIEIPGAENPERVRNLLQGVAKLEFWEVVEVYELNDALLAINDYWVKKQQKEAAVGEELPKMEDVEEEEDLASILSAEDNAADTTALAEEDTLSENNLDSLMNARVSPLFALNRAQDRLMYEVSDTAKINDIIYDEQVQKILPRNVKTLWEVKPQRAETGEEYIQLYFVEIFRGGKPKLDGEVITDARQDFDEFGRPAVSMQMNPTGTRIWRKMTADAASQSPRGRIAIVLDDRVYSAPSVNGEIPTGNSQISGNFTVEEARDLANVLKAGSLPAPTRIVEEAVVGPTLGQVAQQQGIISMVAGLALVIIFMVAYYSKGGLVANIALAFNVFFVLGILAQLNASLTLPGIAGIVLTIGMSIDANVLIFERIREEMRNGANLKAAIKEGYQKAFSSIIDSNITTFLTAVILYVLGQGPVKGFAITLMIGIACSFFSAVYITRVIVEWMSRKGDQSKVSFANPFSANVLSNVNINFLGKRRIGYIVSAAVITLGMILTAVMGLNLGVDFKGGRSYVLNFAEPVKATELRLALQDDFEGAGLEVKNFGGNNVVKVTTSYLVEDETMDADEKVRNSLITGVQDHTGLQYTTNDRGVDQEHFAIGSYSKVGATIADDIWNASLMAGALSLIVIFLYILIRFRRWQFGGGAIAALIHDILMVFSFFAIARLFGVSFEIDQVFIAALLTVIGYSINDTVIVFDRIREYLQKGTSKDTMKVFNSAINSTLNRTMITSLTTLFVVLILFIFGGEVLRGFSYALLVGIIVGTYSSIFVASPIVIELDKNVGKKEVARKEKEKQIAATA
ncbi:MAG: protein translocase subunit SecDF [Candidatus Cyclobacteriaceae bacterium M2_1C_046]